MKKILIILCITAVSLPVFGQSIDPSGVDLTRAQLSIAGPDRVYVSNIYYGETRLSVLLKFDGEDGAIIYGPWFDDDKLIKDYYNLGYATLRVQGDDTLLVSDIILGGQGYSGRLKFDGVSRLKLDGFWQSMTPSTAEMEIANLEARLLVVRNRYDEQLRAADTIRKMQVDELEAELAAAKKAALAAGADVSAIAAAALPSDIQLFGFAGGRSLNGTWDLSSSGLSHTDNDEYFAKFMIPFNQSSSQTLYSFDAKATGDGYTGYGLHFYQSDDLRTDGYGYGTSYLVWVTRDPGFYGNDAAYIQVYRSNDDVDMDLLASAMLSDPIVSTNTTEILYERSGGVISVSVNGSEYIKVTVSDPIRSGEKIALRALGGNVMFSDLTISVK